jgi:L-aminopeptidase/D-esterase-like protein
MKGGLGTASERSFHGVITGAVAAVNVWGDVIDPATGRIIAGAREDDGKFADAVEVLRQGRAWQPAPSQNTVLVVVASNAALTKEQANRLAAVCHDGIARAVRPAHTQSDGDTIFALSTGEHPLDGLDYRIVEALATRAVERAILRGVLTAETLGGIAAARDMASPRIRRGR